MNKSVWSVAAALTLLLACDQGGSGGEPACTLTVDTLAGKAFVMSEAQPNNQPNKPNPLARMTFVEDGGKLKAKYTAMSVSDVYTYECTKQEKKDGKEELLCAEAARTQDWCEALIARDKACTRKKLTKLGSTLPEPELDKAIKAAKDAWKAVEKDGSERDQKIWKLRRQSLGNKLQGRLFAKVDSRCRLRIDDLYWTLDKEGNKVEDSNPAGTNPFELSDQSWMFEHCTDTASLWDLEKDEFPKEAIGEAPKHSLGKPIYYFYTGKKGVEPEEGCSYSFNTYAGWLPVSKDLKPTEAEGKLVWRAEHTYSDKDVREVNGKQGALFHMERFKECGGKKELIDVTCRASVL